MNLRWLLTIAMLASLLACREAEDLPNPYTDGGILLSSEDAGPIPDGAVGSACPCHPALTEVQEGAVCVCRRPCAPGASIPRCVGWEICAQLRQTLGDGGSRLLDAGVCLSAGGPNATCSPEPCGEILRCARISQQDAGNTCRYSCAVTGDASVEDATGSDATPATGTCPPGQRCYGMGGTDGGACFVP